MVIGLYFSSSPRYLNIVFDVKYFAPSVRNITSSITVSIHIHNITHLFQLSQRLKVQSASPIAYPSDNRNAFYLEGELDITIKTWPGQTHLELCGLNFSYPRFTKSHSNPEILQAERDTYLNLQISAPVVI